MIENNHLHYEKFLNKHIQLLEKDYIPSEIINNQILISRVFSKATLEEVYEELESINTEFSMKTY